MGGETGGESLEKSQTKVSLYKDSLFDGTSTVTENVTVTVTGVNENAVITVGAGNSSTGTVTEDTSSGALTSSGTLSFSDVDLGDTHTVTAVWATSGAHGTRTA